MNKQESEKMNSQENVPFNKNSWKRRNSLSSPPMMSDVTPLRILLLGKSMSENSKVGNFILGRSAFDSKAPLDVVERVGGRLKHRPVILINSSQLLHTKILDHQITQTVRECVSLSDPGPHVVLLLLQHEQCSAEDQDRVEKLLDYFSEHLLHHSMVFSTQEPTQTNDIPQNIIHKCSNRHFSLQGSSSPDDLLKVLEDIEQSNNGRHLLCDRHEVSKCFTERHGERLNMMVCGSDVSLKSSISELIQQQTHRRSESVRPDVDLHDHLFNVQKLPALFNARLSEEEKMHQVSHCVSLCHPGVHAFLFIISDASLNNQDRAEMEEIQRIFSSRINKHLIIILIKQKTEHQRAELSEETQAVIKSFGGRHHFYGAKTQMPTLMKIIEQMLEENSRDFFSAETFLEAQMKKTIKYEDIREKFKAFETHLLPQVPTDNEDELRIVLLGKTGAGKSATGNTILERDVFIAEEESFESITKESQRETCEINGRQVTLIDTPGLFDNELSEEEIQREIRHCISMILPGPHVFLLLIPLGRFTKEAETSVKVIQEMFGENSLRYIIVLFTRGDNLKNKTIDQCLGKPDSMIRNLIRACGGRFHVFNNKETEDRTQVNELLKKIDNMVKANGGSFYSCKMFRQMEREKQEQLMKSLMERFREAVEEMKKLEEEKDRMNMIIKEKRQNLKREEVKYQREIQEQMKRERETFRNKIEEMSNEMEKIRTETDKLRTKYEKETERLKNTIENERKKKEDENREREEKYKKQIKEKEEKDKEIKREQETSRLQIEEMRNEIKKIKTEKEKFKTDYETETNERKVIEKEYREREEKYKTQLESEQETFRNKIEEMRKENEKIIRERDNLKTQYKTETERLKDRIENDKKKIEEYRETEEKYKTQIKENEKKVKEMESAQAIFRPEIEKMTKENEKIKTEKDNFEAEYKTKTETLMNKTENETKKNEEESRKVEKEEKERNTYEEIQGEKLRREEENVKRTEKELIGQEEFNEELKQETDKMEREIRDLQSKHEENEKTIKTLTEQMNKEREELMKKHEEKKRDMKIRKEAKCAIKEDEKQQSKIQEQMKRTPDTSKHEIEKSTENKIKTVCKTETDRLMNRNENETNNREEEKVETAPQSKKQKRRARKQKEKAEKEQKST